MAFIDENNNLVIDQGFAYDILGLVPGSIITVSIVSSNSSIPEAYIYDTDTVLSGVGDSTTFEVADTSIRVTANAGGGTVVVLSITYAGEETPSLYSYPSIVPAAVSSELDESGEERIHIAPYAESGEITPEPEGIVLLANVGEGTTIFSANWPEGYDRTQPITVMKDGSYVSTILNQNGSIFRYNVDSWYIDDGFIDEWVFPVQLQQGDWSVQVTSIGADTPIVAFRPSQTYPITSYWETDLEVSSGWNSSFPLQVVLGGQTYTMTYENINGTFTYVYDEGFPDDITTTVVAQVTNGTEVYNAYVTSVINIPLISMNSTGNVDMSNREYYGWVGNTGTSFTLTKGSTTHTYNRVPSTTTYAPTVPISGTIVRDESDPWTMTWDTGSCLVAVAKSSG